MLQQAFVTKLMAFADNHADDDPAVARDALERVLVIDPEHPDARRRFGEFGGGDDTGRDGGGAGAPVPKAPPGPFERLRKGPWHDLLARKSLGTKSATYGPGGSMFVDAAGGSIMTPTERIKTGERFVVEIDFRVLEEHQRSWLLRELPHDVSPAAREAQVVGARVAGEVPRLVARSGRGEDLGVAPDRLRPARGEGPGVLRLLARLGVTGQGA